MHCPPPEIDCKKSREALLVSKKKILPFLQPWETLGTS